MRRAIVPVLVVLSLGLAACGSDDGGSGSQGASRPEPSRADAAATVREALEGFLRTTDPEESCVAGATPRFVRELYGSLDVCRAYVRRAGEAEAASLPEIGEIVLDGDTATVTLEQSRGQEATIVMVSDDGGATWRADTVGTDYLRSGVLGSIEPVDEGILADDDLKDCVRRRIVDLEAPKLRAFIRANAAADAEAIRDRTFDVLATCPDELGAAVAVQLVDALVAADAVPTRLRDCTVDVMSFTLPLTAGDDGGVAADLVRGGKAASDAVSFAAPAVQAAVESCRKDPDARLVPEVRDALRQTED